MIIAGFSMSWAAGQHCYSTSDILSIQGLNFTTQGSVEKSRITNRLDDHYNHITGHPIPKNNARVVAGSDSSDRPKRCPSK